MAEKPVIFSAPMVLALRDGRKHQTRRLLTLRGHRRFSRFGRSKAQGHDWTFRDASHRCRDLRQDELASRLPYATGDRLWVRETCRAEELPSGERVIRYRADNTLRPVDDGHDAGRRWLALHGYRGHSGTPAGPWVPPIHVPRWTSRLTRTVSLVRVQQLHDIDDGDACAEGVRETAPGRWHWQQRPSGEAGWPSPRDAFSALWQSIHGADGWTENPWVIAIGFEPQEGTAHHV